MIATTPGARNGRVIIVSNRLPVSVKLKSEEVNVTPSVGGLATGLSSFHLENDGLWIGWPGLNPVDEKKMNEIEQTLRTDYNCLPVYLSAAEMKKYYYGFSNRTLWPLFHYFTTYSTYNAAEWESYKRVNRIFCERLLEVIKPGDLVWVHDYHLLLLPEMLRRERPDATIGYFLHIPFPSMEIFRNLPWREEILKGMLGADLIGFHTYDYTRHFLSCVLRILGKEQLYGQIIAGNRMVSVDTFPMGIDAQKFIDAASKLSKENRKKSMREKLKAEKIILSVDRLDFTKGIPGRLKAYELFLERNPQWHGKISYILLCVPSRTKVREYQQLKSEIDELVGKINGRFESLEWLPIIYMYRSLPFAELVALYSAADLALVTPLRDGMNLVAKEYLACQGQEGKGVLVLSETAGSAAELGEALLVNPNDVEMMARVIAEGLALSDQEKQEASDFMFRRIKKYNVYHWAEDFISHLAQAKDSHDFNSRRFLSQGEAERLKTAYAEADSRLLLLDYDGTLVALKKRPELAAPDQDILNNLSRLAADPGNTVVIVSGRDRAFLEEWLLDTGVEIVAEHGAWILNAAQKNWQISDRGLNDEWKQNILPILEMFSVRTPGSFVEEKAFALAWHYRKADPELGNLRAKELADALHDILAGTELKVLQGKKVLEIKPAAVNKGKAVMHWLEKKEETDFILAMGDDWTDEDLFAVLPEDAWSIKVGFAPITRATFFLESAENARDLIDQLRN